VIVAATIDNDLPPLVAAVERLTDLVDPAGQPPEDLIVNGGGWS